MLNTTLHKDPTTLILTTISIILKKHDNQHSNTQHQHTVIMLSTSVTTVVYAKRSVFIVMLKVVMVNDDMLNVVAPTQEDKNSF